MSYKIAKERPRGERETSVNRILILLIRLMYKDREATRPDREKKERLYQNILKKREEKMK